MTSSSSSGSASMSAAHDGGIALQRQRDWPAISLHFATFHKYTVCSFAINAKQSGPRPGIQAWISLHCWRGALLGSSSLPRSASSVLRWAR